MRDDTSVIALVSGARNGDKLAWCALVERYAPLVWSICRRHGLSRSDADDVGQTTWLRLVEHVQFLREPAALPGWIATTTRRECLRVLRVARLVEPASTSPEVEELGDDALVDEEILAHERNAVLRAAFAELPHRCQLLLSLLMHDPPMPYGEISARLRMAMGSIGPNRARCLDRIRQHPAVAALIEAEVTRDERR